MAGCCSFCWDCCKCLSLLMVALCLILIASIYHSYHFRLPEWVEKSDCSQLNQAGNQAACLCPHFEIDDYDSSFVAFDVCLSNNSTVPDNLQSCLKHSYAFNRGAVSIGSSKVENILIYLSDFNISDYQLNNECSQSSVCEMNDIFAHIIVYDYPKSFNNQKTYINHYSIKLTSRRHAFTDDTLSTKIDHILDFKSQIDISYVAEYGCFDRNYWGNSILFQHMNTRKLKNGSFTEFAPIVHIVVNDKIQLQTAAPIRLSITFNAQSIFKFKIQSLLHMSDKEIHDAAIHAPEMLISSGIFWGLSMGGDYYLNSVNSFDEMQNVLTSVSTMFGSMVIATIFGLISLQADFKYWTNSKLTMKNICCAAILIYSIVPLIYSQQPAYTVAMDNPIFEEQQSMNSNINAADDYYTNFSKKFGDYLETLPSEELVVVVMTFLVMIFMVFITAFVYVIFPILKAIKSFKLKQEEGVRNDVVAVFEGLLVIMTCVVIGCKNELMYCFSRYVGMAIFIPQILINYCLGNLDTAPKLPLNVWCIAIVDQTITSLMFYYTTKDIEYKTFDIAYWIRDVLILIILYAQWKFRMNKVIEQKNDCQNTVEGKIKYSKFGFCLDCCFGAMFGVLHGIIGGTIKHFAFPDTSNFLFWSVYLSICWLVRYFLF